MGKNAVGRKVVVPNCRIFIGASRRVASKSSNIFNKVFLRLRQISPTHAATTPNEFLPQKYPQQNSPVQESPPIRAEKKIYKKI